MPQEKITTGQTLRVWRNDRMTDVDLLDLTDEEVDVWLEQKRRYGEGILFQVMKGILKLLRSLTREEDQEETDDESTTTADSKQRTNVSAPTKSGSKGNSR